ncbi:MAG: hypothetical protein A2847_02210 [Candidatus Sungbacteria bacterium RIFCSPHIGHO2_01_FULL_50_25]|uniref:Orotate phosphoribosyltransferase n=1 Tax=Candidatus Sungbacteria bacterium RIFCSPHIGHO2_01_FULL_50_25 TaxID=1802265 RepID=A0A1G2K6B1_9BACT|nr:MAG: hypothetical protein A2847_02210 [Candidatus Sungbacteria bacterium RIFCSPHIGHO2_01_FULL_50_25]
MHGIPLLPWLDSAKQREVVRMLVHYGLLRFSKAHDLVLKSGRTTDIYINLRDARNNPEAIKRIAGLFIHPLMHLGIQRFVEIPDSVSCFAGLLATETGLPYITVRKEAKPGRVSKPRVIGEAKSGEEVAILDDVVTDGASKIEPYRECVRAGLRVKALVVLVDREEGWREKFAAEGIDLHVWAGMTLCEVRRILAEESAA